MAKSRDARDRDSGSRRQPRRRSGSGGVWLTLFILVAIFAALGVGFKDMILNYIKGEGKTQVAEKPPPKPAREFKAASRNTRQPAKRAAAPKKVVKPPAPKRKRADPGTASGKQQAHKLLENGHLALAALKFQDASGLFRQASGVSGAGADLRRQARILNKMAETFDKVTRDVRVAPEALNGQKFVRFEMMDGAVVEGVIESETRTIYRIKRKGGIRAPLRKEDVRKRTKISPSELEEWKQKKLLAAMRGIEEGPALTSFLKGRAAFQLQLKDKAVRELQNAYEQNSDLVAMLDNYSAGKLFRGAMWSDSVGSEFMAKRQCRTVLEKYGHTPFKEAAQGLLELIEERGNKKRYKRTFQIKEKKTANTKKATITVVDETPESTQQTDRIRSVGSSGLDRANSIFAEAVALYRQRKYKVAIKKFDQCIALYDKALKKDPRNASLESRLTDASMLRYGCFKYQTAF